MRFYRIENSEKKGCYAGLGKRILNTVATVEHPMPFEDSLLARGLIRKNISETFDGRVRFGFTTIKQFRSWFYDDADIRVLMDNKFVLNVYDVPSVIKGNAQAVILAKFHTSDRLKKTIPLCTFLLTTTSKIVTNSECDELRSVSAKQPCGALTLTSEQLG